MTYIKCILAIVVLSALPACTITSSYVLSEKGSSIDARYRDGTSIVSFPATTQYDGLLAVFRQARPLESPPPAESDSDVIFTLLTDGKTDSKFILCRDGELLHEGKWYRVDQKWLYRWQSNYDRRNSRKPIQPPKPKTALTFPSPVTLTTNVA